MEITFPFPFLHTDTHMHTIFTWALTLTYQHTCAGTSAPIHTDTQIHITVTWTHKYSEQPTQPPLTSLLP